MNLLLQRNEDFASQEINQQRWSWPVGQCPLQLQRHSSQLHFQTRGRSHQQRFRTYFNWFSVVERWTVGFSSISKVKEGCSDRPPRQTEIACRQKCKLNYWHGFLFCKTLWIINCSQCVQWPLKSDTYNCKISDFLVEVKFVGFVELRIVRK